MPRHHLQWRNLLAGLLVLAGLITVTVIILLFAQVGGVRGKKATIFIVTPSASGVIRGTPVWLSGTQIGTVRAVTLRSTSADTGQRLLLRLSVAEERLAFIPKGSPVSIHPGGTMIGAPVIDITPSAASGTAIHEGDTLATLTTSSVETTVSRAEELITETRAVIAESRAIWTSMGPIMGRVNQLMALANQVSGSASKGIKAFKGRAANRQGTLALAMHDPELGIRARAALAGVDSLRQFLSTDRGVVGRFRRDSTLIKQVAALRQDVNALRAMADSGSGGIAAARKDTVLRAQMARARMTLDSLIADIKKHPSRYISLRSISF
jgi:phospholipid/cholesterol/gamma-HCH transport system substrate-binding protein